MNFSEFLSLISGQLGKINIPAAFVTSEERKRTFTSGIAYFAFEVCVLARYSKELRLSISVDSKLVRLVGLLGAADYVDRLRTAPSRDIMSILLDYKPTEPDLAAIGEIFFSVLKDVISVEPIRSVVSSVVALNPPHGPTPADSTVPVVQVPVSLSVNSVLMSLRNERDTVAYKGLQAKLTSYWSGFSNFATRTAGVGGVASFNELFFATFNFIDNEAFKGAMLPRNAMSYVGEFAIGTYVLEPASIQKLVSNKFVSLTGLASSSLGLSEAYFQWLLLHATKTDLSTGLPHWVYDLVVVALDARTGGKASIVGIDSQRLNAAVGQIDAFTNHSTDLADVALVRAIRRYIRDVASVLYDMGYLDGGSLHYVRTCAMPELLAMGSGRLRYLAFYLSAPILHATESSFASYCKYVCLTAPLISPLGAVLRAHFSVKS